MSNSQNAIYAILADSVYWDVRYGINKDIGVIDDKNINWTPVPSDWTLIEEKRDLASGFAARAFKNSNFS